MALIFYDETGINPLPPGIGVTLYQPGTQYSGGSGPPSTALYLTNLGIKLGSAFTTPGGIANLYAPTAVPCVAVFSMSGQAPGSQTPGVPPLVSFIGRGESTTVIVGGYRSPTLAPASWAQLQTQLWPKGWFSDTARAPGGVAYAIAVLRSGALGQATTFAEIVQQAMRLQSSVGTQIDSWANDFFPNQVMARFSGEPDAAYLGRIFALLQMPRNTLQAILAVVTAFYTSLSLISSFTEAQALDILGGLDVAGGLDLAVVPGSISLPPLQVWDRQSQPGLANKYSINPDNDNATFVVQIGAASDGGWYLDNSALDHTTALVTPNVWSFSSTPPDPRLGALVNFVKAGGTQAIYMTAPIPQLPPIASAAAA